MPLHLVPKSEPSQAEKVRSRVRGMPKPDGMLQCPRCGGRTIMTSKNGVMIVNGRKKWGTVIHEDVCADCYKKGDIVYVSPKIEQIE